MTKGIYQVGDIVTIRQWEDMRQEFGPTRLGGLAVPFTFSSNMRSYCGRKYRIRKIENMQHRDYNRVFLEPLPDSDDYRRDNGIGIYKFNEHMFEAPDFIQRTSEILEYSIGNQVLQLAKGIEEVL